MPKYLFIGSYTTEGARGVLAEGGTGRRGAVTKLKATYRRPYRESGSR